MSVRPPFPCHGCQRSFCDSFSNFDWAVRVNGRGACDIVPPKSLRIYRSTAVLGLDLCGWDLNTEILPGSRPRRLDRRPKLPPLSYQIDVWGGVGGRGEEWEKLSNMAEWATIDRSSDKTITQTWVRTSPSNKSVHGSLWRPESLGRSYINSANQMRAGLHIWKVTLKACEVILTLGVWHLEEINGFIAYRFLCSTVHYFSNLWTRGAVNFWQGNQGVPTAPLLFSVYDLQRSPKSNCANLWEKRLQQLQNR